MGLIFWFRLVSCKPSQLSTLVHPICSTPSSPDTKDAARKSRRWIRIWIDVPSDAQDHCHGQRFHGIVYPMSTYSLPLYLPFVPSIGTDSTMLPKLEHCICLKEWDFEDADLLNLESTITKVTKVLLFVNPHPWSLCGAHELLRFSMRSFQPNVNVQSFGAWQSIPLETVNLLAKQVYQRKMASYELLCSAFRSRNFRQVHCLVILGTDLVICVCIQATKPPMWWLAGRYWLKLFCTATQVPCTSACNCDLIIWWIIQCSNPSNLAIWCYVDMLDDR